mgnify:CR=1 FL=1
MGRKAEAYRGMVHMLFEEKITAQELLSRAQIVRAEQMRLSIDHGLYYSLGGRADNTAHRDFGELLETSRGV